MRLSILLKGRSGDGPLVSEERSGWPNGKRQNYPLRPGVQAVNEQAKQQDYYFERAWSGADGKGNSS